MFHADDKNLFIEYNFHITEMNSKWQITDLVIWLLFFLCLYYSKTTKRQLTLRLSLGNLRETIDIFTSSLKYATVLFD